MSTMAHHHHQGRRQPTTTHQHRRWLSTTPHQQRTWPTTRHLAVPWSLWRIHSPCCLLVSSSCVLSSSLIRVHCTHIPLLLVTRECLLFRECVLSSSFIHVQYTDTNLCLLIFSRKWVLLSSLIHVGHTHTQLCLVSGLCVVFSSLVRVRCTHMPPLSPHL